MDTKSKNDIISENIYKCRYGFLQSIIVDKSVKIKYDNNFLLRDFTDYTDVHVKSVHSLILVKELIKKNPVIVNIVSSEFDGSALSLFDDFLAMKTNFCQCISSELFPISKNIIYTPFISIIRDEEFKINIKSIVTSAMITASLVVNPRIIEKKYMNLTDHTNTIEIIETIFQTCIKAGHDTIIFGNLACKYNKIPFEDIVDILNLSILKYGGSFKYIYFAIPRIDQFDALQYDYFFKKIIRPQELFITDE